MSEVEEAPAWGGLVLADDGLVAKRNGIEDLVMVRREVEIPAERKLFAGLGNGRGDDLDEVLKGKGRLPSNWADMLDDTGVDEDEMDIGDDVLSEVGSEIVGGRVGRWCDGGCSGWITALEQTLGRVESIVKMLVALGGLASLGERLAVQKHRGQMAKEWDTSVAKAGGHAKAEAVVKAARTWLRRRETEDTRAEEARVRQEEVVRVKEAARLAAEGERDRLASEMKKYTEGPEAVTAAEKVVEAARLVMELEREVTAGSVGGWQVAGGKKRKTVQVVAQMCRPLDGERRKALQGAVTKVQGLVGAANLGWGLVASPYIVHDGDDILWTVCEVNEGVNGSKVAKVVLRNLEAVWEVGSLVGCWVENKLSAYVVLQGIPEREWLSDKGGVQGFVEGNAGTMWGPRQPVVVSKAWNRVDVKVELETAEAAKGAVMQGLAYYRVRRTVKMAVGGGSASVIRGQTTAPVPPRPGVFRQQQTRVAKNSGRRGKLVEGCFWCGKMGHWKYECPSKDRVDNRSCFTCGRKGHVSRDYSQRVAAAGPQSDAVKRQDQVEYGPAERRMGPNERGCLEAKDTFFDDKRVWKTMEEIEKAGGPLGARS